MKSMVAVKLFAFFCTNMLQEVVSISLNNPCDSMVKGVYTVNSLHESTILPIIGFPTWAVTKLNYINCERRGMTSVPDSLPEDVQILSLKYNAIVKLKKDDLSRYRKLEAVYLDQNCLTGEEFYGLPECKGYMEIEQGTFESLSSLKLLSFAGNRLRRIPIDLPVSVEYLDLKDTALNTVSESDVAKLRHLSVLVTSYSCRRNKPHECGIKNFTVEDKALQSMGESLKALDINSNSFYQIPTLHAPDLLYFDISYNPIDKIKNTDFVNTTSIRVLALHYLGIYAPLYLEPETMYPLTELMYLDLSGNSLTNFPARFFSQNKKLLSLDLSFNCLKRVVLNPTFMPWQSLQYLDLSQNEVCIPVPNSTQSPPESPVFQLGSSYENATQLKSLLFGPGLNVTNKLYSFFAPNFETVSKDALKVLKNSHKLAEFSLSYCGIRDIDMAIFKDVPSLRSINLDKNYITKYDNGNNTQNFSLSLQQQVPSLVSKILDAFKISNSTEHVEKRPKRSLAGEPFNCSVENALSFAGNELLYLNKSFFSYTPYVEWLNLSSNGIKHIGDRVFDKMRFLCHIDLRGNPIVTITSHAFSGLPELNYLTIDSSKFTPVSDFSFLANIEHPFAYRYIAGNINLFRKLFLNSYYLLAKEVHYLDISANTIEDAWLQQILHGIFKSFPNLRSLEMRFCSIANSDFYFSDTMPITNLDLRFNALRKLPWLALRSLPSLEHLLLTGNKIASLDKPFFHILRNITFIDLSYNYIGYIAPGFFANASPTFKYLILSNNLIVDIGPTVFPKSLLLQLDMLDIRWNAVSCHCAVTENFGTWLQHGEYDMIQRPGLFPVCTTLIEQFYGGCVYCKDPASAEKLSLLQFSSQKGCQGVFSVMLSVVSSSVYLLFLIGAAGFSNSRWKKFLYRFASRDIYQKKTESRDQSVARKRNVFAYNAFVVYDLENNAVGDWVDNYLIPSLTENSSLQIGVVGKENNCCSTPVKQLLLNIQASRKVIVLLSGNFGLSMKGRYVISVLENQIYEKGEDQIIYVTFENDVQSGGLISSRQKKDPLSVMQVPESRDSWPVFTEALRLALTL